MKQPSSSNFLEFCHPGEYALRYKNFQLTSLNDGERERAWLIMSFVLESESMTELA